MPGSASSCQRLRPSRRRRLVKCFGSTSAVRIAEIQGAFITGCAMLLLALLVEAQYKLLPAHASEYKNYTIGLSTSFST